MKKTLMYNIIFFIGGSVVMCAVFFLLFPRPSFPPRPGDMKRHRDRHMERVFRELHLSPEQKQQIEIYHHEEENKMKDSFMGMHELMDAMDEELLKDDLDMNAIKRGYEAMKQHSDLRIQEGLDRMLYMRSVLTREQFRTFLSLMKRKGPPPPP